MGCGTLSRAHGPWDVLPLCPSTASLPCPLPCAGPAWRRTVEELVGAAGLCRVPAPLTAHMLQVRGAAAQPDVSWAGKSQDREGAASLWPPKPGCCTSSTPGPPPLIAPGVGACQHPGGGDGRSPEERGVSAATARDQGPQTPSMEVPSGLLRTWMWYLTPGRRSRRTTQVLAWTSLCRRGARLGSSCSPQIPLPLPGPSMYLPRSRGGCGCASHGCVGAHGWLAGGVPGVLPTGVQHGAAGHLWGAGRAALHLVEEEVQVVGKWWLP